MAPAPGPASAAAENTAPAPPQFMDLPAEIRVKIYEAVFDKVQVEYTLNIMTRGHNPPNGGRHKVMHRVPDHHYPLALLVVNKKVRQEALSIATACPVFLQFTGCGRVFELHLQVPYTIQHRLCGITTDDSVDGIGHLTYGAMACYLPENRPLYPNLRSVEIRGSRATPRIAVSAEVVKKLSQARGVRDYRLPVDVSSQTQTTWWSAQQLQFKRLVDSSQIGLRLHCEFVALQLSHDPIRSIETSITGVSLCFQ